MTADKDALKMLSYELDAVVYDAEHGRFDQTCINTLKMVSSGIAALTAQREAAQQAQEPEFVRERWNIERDGDALLVCFNDHEKTEACRYRRFVPEPQVTQESAAQNIETLKQLLGAALLRLQELGDTSFRFPDSVDTSAPKTVIEATPPFGVREGMLRAEEVCKDRAEAWGHSDFQQSEISEARKREAEELADYFRAEAEKLPQTHVLVPVDTLILMRKAITRDAPYSNAAIIAYDGLKESHAMLRAAQEGKS